MMVDATKLRRDVHAARERLYAILDDEGRFLLDYIAANEAVLARYTAGNRQPRKAATTTTRKTAMPRKRGTKRGATRDAILAIMADGDRHKVGEIATALGKTKSGISAAVRALRDMGVLVDEDYGWYRLAPSANGAQKDKSTAEPTGLFSSSGGGEGTASVGADAVPAGNT